MRKGSPGVAGVVGVISKTGVGVISGRDVGVGSVGTGVQAAGNVSRMRLNTKAAVRARHFVGDIVSHHFWAERMKRLIHCADQENRRGLKNWFFYYTSDYPFIFPATNKIAGSFELAINSARNSFSLSRRDIFPQVVLDGVGCGFSTVINSKL